MKKRLDVVLVERGLAESRAQAQALVMAGLVPGHTKPGEQVDEEDALEVESPPPYVSRGGHKLANALDAFGVDPAGLDCLDLGASTGGFTDCLLQHGAREVVAVDVGHGQLHWKLRQHASVTVIEGANARHLTRDTLPDIGPGVDLVVIDVSFISLTLIFPVLPKILAPGARVIALDVGHGQLHPRVRNDPRVTGMERTNARSLVELPFAPQLVTCDVSFISVRLALPPALALAAPGWQALVLVKPQFEAGRSEVPKGVVRDPEVHERVVREIAEAATDWGARVGGVVDSGLPGPKGNREFVLYLLDAEAG